jgi:hypothetical protein
MKRALTILLLLACGGVIVIGAAKIKTQKSPTFDFSTLKTWAWNPTGAGQVKVWVTAESKSEPVKRQYEPVIMQAVEAELTSRGLQRATTSAPDFIVSYYVLVTLGSATQEMGQFLPAVTEWGLPPFTAQTTATRVYPMGTLVLDVASPDAMSVVWRAVAQAEIDMDKSDEQRAVRLRKVVHDIVEKLPRKK